MERRYTHLLLHEQTDEPSVMHKASALAMHVQIEYKAIHFPRPCMRTMIRQVRIRVMTMHDRSCYTLRQWSPEYEPLKTGM